MIGEVNIWISLGARWSCWKSKKQTCVALSSAESRTQHCQVQLKKLCGLARQLMQDLATQRTIHTAPTVIRVAKNHGSIE